MDYKIEALLFKGIRQLNEGIMNPTEFIAYVKALPECTCSDKLQSQMECRIHGISEQLNRTQME